MAWYWVLLIVVLVQAALLLVFFLLQRNQNAWVAELKQALKESTATRLKEELAIEKEVNEMIAKELTTLAADYKTILGWYEERKNEIENKAPSRLQELVSNPSLLDAKLDTLLGSRAKQRAPDEG